MPSRKSKKRHQRTKNMYTPNVQLKIWPSDAELNPHEDIEFADRNNEQMIFFGQVWDLLIVDGIYYFEVIVDNLVPGMKPLSTWHIFRQGDKWLGNHINDMDFDD